MFYAGGFMKFFPSVLNVSLLGLFCCSAVYAEHEYDYSGVYVVKSSLDFADQCFDIDRESLKITAKDGKYYLGGSLDLGEDTISYDVPVACSVGGRELTCSSPDADCGGLILSYNDENDKRTVVIKPVSGCGAENFSGMEELVSVPAHTYLKYSTDFAKFENKGISAYLKDVWNALDQEKQNRLKPEIVKWKNATNESCGGAPDGLKDLALRDYYVCHNKKDLERAEDLYDQLTEQQKSSVSEYCGCNCM